VVKIGIRGSNTSSPRNLPFKILASITFFINFLMTNRVPLHSLGGFKLRSKIIEDLRPSVVNGVVACLANPMSSKTLPDNLQFY